MAFRKHRHQGACLSLAEIIFIVEDFLCWVLITLFGFNPQNRWVSSLLDE
jgi:hypothetical protein